MTISNFSFSQYPDSLRKGIAAFGVDALHVEQDVVSCFSDLASIRLSPQPASDDGSFLVVIDQLSLTGETQNHVSLNLIQVLAAAGEVVF